MRASRPALHHHPIAIRNQARAAPAPEAMTAALRLMPIARDLENVAARVHGSTASERVPAGHSCFAAQAFASVIVMDEGTNLVCSR